MPYTSNLLSKLVPDITQILERSKVESCSVLVMQTLKDKEGGNFPRLQEGKTFHGIPGRYEIADSSPGSTLVFAIGSLTKLFIALAMFLVFQDLTGDAENEAWNTTFTDIFNKHSQHFKLRPLPGNPTVKDLLVHRHGVPDINDLLLSPDGVPLLSKDHFRQILPDVCAKARYDQDAPAKYSNGNFALLSILIETITQCPFKDYLKSKVLDPLGLTRTFFGPIDSIENEPDWALPYVCYEDGVPHKVQNRISSSDSVASAIMGMYSCTRDMGILYEAFFDALKGKPRIEILDHALVSRMFGFGERGFTSSISNDKDVGYTACGLFSKSDSVFLGFHSLNRLILGDDDSTSFSLGTGKDFDENIYCQTGTITGYGCCAYLVPSIFEAVIVMTNTVGLNDAADHVSRLILQGLYNLKVPQEGRLKLASFRQKKAEVVVKSEKSSEKILERWKKVGIRNPQNVTPILNFERLVGEYGGEFDAQHLTITTENNRTVVTISDGRSRKSAKLGLASLDPRTFRIIPQEPGIDVFGSWDILDLKDVSPENAQRVTRLSRKRGAAEVEADRYYIYELILGSSNDP